MLKRKGKTSPDEEWRRVLTGEGRGHFCWNPTVRRISRAIPSDPRCTLCDTRKMPLAMSVSVGPLTIRRRLPLSMIAVPANSTPRRRA